MTTTSDQPFSLPTDLDRDWVRSRVELGEGFREIRESIVRENRFVKARFGALIEWAVDLSLLIEEENL